MKTREQLAEEYLELHFYSIDNMDTSELILCVYKDAFDKALELALNTMEKINVEKHRDVAMTQDSKYAYANGCFHHMYEEIKKLGES